MNIMSAIGDTYKKSTNALHSHIANHLVYFLADKISTLLLVNIFTNPLHIPINWQKFATLNYTWHCNIIYYAHLKNIRESQFIIFIKINLPQCHDDVWHPAPYKNGYNGHRHTQSSTPGAFYIPDIRSPQSQPAAFCGVTYIWK